MTKTIEEAAKRYAEKVTDNNISENYGTMLMRRRVQKFDSYDMEQAFEGGANYIMQLPLVDRLTAEEKERVRKTYSEAQCWLDEKTSFDNPNEQLRICAVAIQDRLERIFGKDFFKEGE